MFLWFPVLDLARAPRRTARKKGSGYENGYARSLASDLGKSNWDLAHPRPQGGRPSLGLGTRMDLARIQPRSQERGWRGSGTTDLERRSGKSNKTRKKGFLSILNNQGEYEINSSNCWRISSKILLIYIRLQFNNVSRQDMSDVHIYQLNYGFEFLGELRKVIWYHIML